MVSLRRFIICVCIFLPTSVVVHGKKQEKQPKREIEKVSDIGLPGSDNFIPSCWYFP